MDLQAWVVGAVATGILSTLGFLTRSSFEHVNAGLKELAEKMDNLRKDIALQAVEAARLEQRHHSLEQRVQHIERMVQRLSEGDR